MTYFTEGKAVYIGPTSPLFKRLRIYKIRFLGGSGIVEVVDEYGKNNPDSFAIGLRAAVDNHFKKHKRFKMNQFNELFKRIE